MWTAVWFDRLGITCIGLSLLVCPFSVQMLNCFLLLAIYCRCFQLVLLLERFDAVYFRSLPVKILRA